MLKSLNLRNAPEVIRGFLFFLLVFPLWSVDRALTLEGIDKVRSSRYRSVIELVRFELKHNRRESALSKLNYHLDHNPNDSEALQMLGQIQLEDGQRHLAINTWERASALGSRSAALQLKKLLSEVEQDKALILKQSEFTNLFLDPDSFSIKPVAKEITKSTANDFKKGGMQELSLLRALDSLVSAYVQNVGPMKEFSLKSLQTAKILTRDIDVSNLGLISLDGGRVKSSVYGTYLEQQKLQASYLKAYKLYQEGNCTEALKLLLSISNPSVSELRFAIELAKQCEKDKEPEIRQKLLALDGQDYDNLLYMANQAYQLGDHAKARSLYVRLLNTAYAQEAERQIKIIDGGGSHRLRELLNRQREEALKNGEQ